MDRIERIVQLVYTELNITDKKLIVEALYRIVLYFCQKNIIDLNEMLLQLELNNGRDLIGILNILLPYINDDTYEKRKKIKALNDIYITKTSPVDINTASPEYVYSNLQYGRCVNNGGVYTELQFDKKHLEDSETLLKKTIELTAHKFMCNWINIKPCTKERYERLKIEYEQAMTDNKFLSPDYNGVNIGDIYNIIVNRLYKDILRIKWVVFDLPINEIIYPRIVILNQYLNLDDIVQGTGNYERFERDWKKIKLIYNHENAITDIINEVLTNFTENKSFNLEEIDTDKLYEYLEKVIDELKNTWYSRLITPTHIMNYDEYTKYRDEHFKFRDGPGSFTFSNVFAFAAILGNKSDSWVELSLTQRQDFATRLRSPGWFNIITQLDDLGFPNAKQRNKIIEETLLKTIHTIVFQEMIRGGLLNEFTFSKDYKTNIEENRDLFDEAYNFVDNRQYKNITYKNVESKTGSREDVKYLDYNCINCGDPWFTRHSANWVTQLSIFHRYIHTRIMYVTGSTGTGKSTGVPIMFLYAMKMIDCNWSGHAVCTQPRQAPAESNARTVAMSVGAPIEVYNNTLKKDIREPNYIIQYKHKKRSHIKKSANLSLTFVTDGMLLKQLVSSPNLQKKKDLIYNIVMIDEAHEHNPNMDIILSLMKTALQENPTLKLVIISATMQEDEPVYRRFYRDIDDNKLPNAIEGVDRNNVDRRIDISVPMQTTLFKIIDKYIPTRTAEEVIMEILTSSTDGDILAFQPGQAEIHDLVTKLNAKTAPDVLAIGYYSEMRDDVRKIIEKLDNETKRQLTVQKTGDKPVAQGTYSRVIIIATNIAEASLTIKTLKYVVDDGRQKIGIYDPLTRQTTLKLFNYISESSRVQRRGRVGRVASGTVYYLYPENTMALNKTLYKICTADLTDVLLDLIRTKSGTYYTSDTLRDDDKTFYIIHPDEITFSEDKATPLTRNIAGKPINAKPSTKIDIFFKQLLRRKFIEQDGNDYYKSDLGEKLKNIPESIQDEDIRMVMAYLYARSYNVDNEILMLWPWFTLLAESYKSISTFIETPPIKSSRINQYNNSFGDPHGLIKLMKEALLLFDVKPVDRTKINNSKEQYLQEKKTGNYTLESKLLDDFLELDYTGKLDKTSNTITNRELKALYSVDAISHINKPKYNEKTLTDWCKLRDIPLKRLLDCVKNYYRLSNEINKWTNSYIQSDYDITKITDFKLSGSATSSNHAVTLSLMHGFPDNICRRIDNQPAYINIGTYNILVKRPDTLLNIESLYLHYLISKEELSGDQSIRCISVARVEDIRKLKIEQLEPMPLDNKKLFSRPGMLILPEYTNTIQAIERELGKK